VHQRLSELKKVEKAKEEEAAKKGKGLFSWPPRGNTLIKTRVHFLIVVGNFLPSLPPSFFFLLSPFLFLFFLLSPENSELSES